MARSLVVALACFVVLASPVPLVSAQQPAAARPFTLTGYAEASYTGSTNAAGEVVVGRLYDRFHDQFMLNALALTLDKAYDPARRSAGFHAEVLFGQNAAVIKSGGFLGGADEADLPHLYVTLNVPTANGNGVQFKVGRIPTLLGLEVIETIANPNWSEGNQFVYVENFTGLGLSIETKLSDKLDAQLRLINGWDVVRDNNRAKSLMARVGLYPNANTSIAFVGFLGPEQARDASASRSGVEVLAWRKFGKAALWVQGDVGTEEANGALSQDAQWWAVGAWLTYDLSATVALAIRGDVLNDENGARTSGVFGFPVNTGHDLSSLTGTLNVRTWPGALVRPEVRYDHSSLPAFAGEESQITFALSVAYLF